MLFEGYEYLILFLAGLASGSFNTRRSNKPFTIPMLSKDHNISTQQFTATGSMQSQKHRAQAGQLFINNFGQLAITIQTGSLSTTPGAWETGPQTILTNAGGAATAGTRDAFIMGAPFTPATVNSGSAIYDGIGWTRVSDATAGHGATQANCSIGTVDAALFLRHSGGIGNGTNSGRYGSFPNTPAIFPVSINIKSNIPAILFSFYKVPKNLTQD